MPPAYCNNINLKKKFRKKIIQNFKIDIIKASRFQKGCYQSCIHHIYSKNLRFTVLYIFERVFGYIVRK